MRKPVVSVRDPARPMPPEDREALHALLQVMCARLETYSSNVQLRFITSLMLSYSMATADPPDTLATIVDQAAQGLARAMIQERERGGNA